MDTIVFPLNHRMIKTQRAMKVIEPEIKRIQAEIKKGRITFGHGRALLEVQDTNEQRRLAQDVIAKELSVRELENLIKLKRPKAIKRNIGQGQREPYVAALEEEMQHALGTKVRISKRKNLETVPNSGYQNNQGNKTKNDFFVFILGTGFHQN